MGNSILDTEIINGSYPRKYSSSPAIAPLVSGRVSESSGIVYRTVVRPVCPIPNPYRSSQVHNLMRLESRVKVVRVAHRGNLCLDHRMLSAAVSFALRNAASESEPFQVSFRSRERRLSRSSPYIECTVGLQSEVDYHAVVSLTRLILRGCGGRAKRLLAPVNRRSMS